jgi:hypothetical protein
MVCFASPGVLLYDVQICWFSLLAAFDWLLLVDVWGHLAAAK